MGVETTVSLSLIFSCISMIGVIINITVLLKKENELNKQKEVQIEKHFTQIDVKLDDFLNRITQIVNNSEKSAEKIDTNLQKIIATNERISTLFRLHDENERRIARIEEIEKNMMKPH